jgi:hypothetical protein
MVMTALLSFHILLFVVMPVPLNEILPLALFCLL